ARRRPSRGRGTGDARARAVARRAGRADRRARGRRRAAVKAIVVGSGFGGLACAIRLAVKGYDVTVLEKRDKPGGRAYVFEQDGFTFDAGPTIITAPFLFEELFTLAGRKIEEYARLFPIDPFYEIR